MLKVKIKKEKIEQNGSEIGQYFIFIYLWIDIHSFFTKGLNLFIQ